MSDFEDVKPYTQAELDQQAIWANEFDQWWENEGQYHRAGGNDYCRTFAWWAWLNREQLSQAKIDDLQKRIDYAFQEVKGLERFTGEDCIADFEVLQGAVSHACKRLEKTLLGEVTLEPKWTTIKVVCQKCGHYLSGCHCNHFGDQCPHLNTSMFGDDGLAECFNCNKIINKDREVVGDVDDQHLTR